MPLELKDESATWWITDAELVPGGDKETRYKVRRLTLDKHREITKRHTKPGTYRRPEGKVDQDAIQDDLFDYVLTAWEGVNASGEAVPCEWESKRLLDVPRRVALLDAAGMNDLAAVESARNESFRSAADVR
jgi:hypothetical protein